MRQSILTMAVCAAVLCGGTARARGQCVGDCSGSGAVAVNDLITMVNIALGNSDVAACRAGDADGGGTITINEIIAAVNNDLNGCPPEPTNSPAGVGTPTSTPTATLTPTQTAPPTPCTGRFCDNGDGTITDTTTGLMWEKKDSAVGIHNKDTTYTWSTTGTAADGTAFTDFLVKLNTPPCFAGHCDWRLPSEEGQNPPGTGPNELESIVDTGVTGCGPSPSPACVAPAFDSNCQTGCSVDGAGNTPTCSCTQSSLYWSSTTSFINPLEALLVYFGNAPVQHTVKTVAVSVRAVRCANQAGCPPEPTHSPAPTVTPTSTATSIQTAPGSPASTGAATAPSTPTPTPTQTATASPTSTATATATSTPTPCTTGFCDNGDGTITDTQTGLMWEKKDNAGGIHDVGREFSWNATLGGTATDGTAFTDFLATLNTPPCFAGHCDWRLPQSAGVDQPGDRTGQAPELESILAGHYQCMTNPCACPSNPCVPAVFNNNCTPGCTVGNCSCTQSGRYWSSTTWQTLFYYAWFVDYGNGSVDVERKNTTFNFHVRAVRRAVACTSRFCDNGDGTVTDNQTGLMWEKKSDDGGIHDKDRTFSWSSTGTAADGTAFTDFLATLNKSCFAAHCDWRLPKSGGTAGSPSGEPAELESILAAPSPCTGLADPCVPPVFNTGCAPGCTVTGCSCTQSQSGYYWSATNVSSDPGSAWQVFFNNGTVINGAKTFNTNPLSHNVRAVRGGP